MTLELWEAPGKHAFCGAGAVVVAWWGVTCCFLGELECTPVLRNEGGVLGWATDPPCGSFQGLGRQGVTSLAGTMVLLRDCGATASLLNCRQWDLLE